MIELKYNFDEVIDRRNSDCVKWDTLEDSYGVSDILPMWIADMDFKSADEIIEALKTRAECGVFGYNFRNDGFYDSIIKWVKDRYNWEIKKEWIVFTPGVVAGFNIGIRALTKESEAVIIQPPVYPPFARVINSSNRKLVTNPLVNIDGKYRIDFDDLEEKIKTSKTLLFCSPHNPVGRVWNEEELNKVAKLAIENKAVIISDEIHCDLTFNGVKHTMIASLSKEMAMNSITLIAPSKTFNIAGLFTSVAIIPNDDIRERVNKEIELMEIDHVSIFGAVGLEAAYNHGAQWLEELKIYLEGNTDYVIEYIEKNIPKIKANKPDGTYLLWLDCRELGLDQNALNDLMIKKGKVLLNDGSTFGIEGEGFLRLNIGCSRATVMEAMKRIEKAVNSIE